MIKQLLLLASNIPAALVGGGTFLLLLLVFNLGIPFSFLISIASYLITGVLIFPAKSALEQEREKLLKGVLKEGEQKLAQMNALSKKITNSQVRSQIGTIRDIAGNIFEAVKKNPQYVKSAQQFSVYYLDATLKIIGKYLELSGHAAYSSDVQQSLRKVETMLNDLQNTYEKQLSAILGDHVLDLDTELSVLEETIEIEHL